MALCAGEGALMSLPQRHQGPLQPTAIGRKGRLPDHLSDSRFKVLQRQPTAFEFFRLHVLAVRPAAASCALDRHETTKWAGDRPNRRLVRRRVPREGVEPCQ
jgi:hypothetical protein